MADRGLARRRREPQEGRPLRRGSPPVLRPVLGVLVDGTPHYAPVGEVWEDDEKVCCHLCGGWYRSVGAHLPSHGWSRSTYRAAFGLEVGASLEGAVTRRRRADAFRPRRIFDPAVRDGIARGHDLARSGELARCASVATTGRRQPAQRRAKTLQALAAVSAEAKADAVRRRRLQDLQRVAAQVAAENGFADLEAYVADRLAAGLSLAAASRAAGLHKDWLQRHLGAVAPGAVVLARQGRHIRADVALLQRVRGLGFVDVREYLVQRHRVEQRTVRAIALELAVSRSRIEAALQRHGLPLVPHVTARAQVLGREAAIAAGIGVDSLREFVSWRRAQAATWDQIAAECGVTPSWLRRRVTAWAAAGHEPPPDSEIATGPR